MEAFLTPDEKLFVRLVTVYPPRPFPLFKLAAGFIGMVGFIALACLVLVGVGS